MSILNFPNTERFDDQEFTDQTNTGTHFQGTYTLDVLRIKLKNGQTVELGTVFTEFEVFEDVFKYAIEGRVRLRDYVGGIEKFLITGGEEIAIRLLKPNGNTEVIVSRDDLIVVKISEIILMQGNSRSYDLFFRSKATVNSMKKKVFKSYGNDRNMQSVVQKLFSEMDTRVENLSIIESNIGLNRSFDANGLRPLEAINFLAKRACVNGDYCLFFERFASNPTEKFTHVFVGFNTLKDFWTKNNSIPKIKYEPNVSRVSYINFSENESNVFTSYVRFEPNFDHMSNTKAGFYNSRIRSIDLISQSYTDTEVNYKKESEENIKSIYKNKFIEENSIFNQYEETTIERLIVSPTNDPILRKEEWLKYDTYGSVINTGMRATVEISGGSNKIGAGSLVELSIPSAASKTLRLETPVPHEDQVYSGKYMVTAVKHFITPKTYNKTLELSRGSLRFDIDKQVEKFEVIQ
jgi:hypothetical protein